MTVYYYDNMILSTLLFWASLAELASRRSGSRRAEEAGQNQLVAAFAPMEPLGDAGDGGGGDAMLFGNGDIRALF